MNLVLLLLFIECVSEGNRLSSEMCHWHFHFILPITPDKAAYERGAALCSAVTGEAAIFAPNLHLQFLMFRSM